MEAPKEVLVFRNTCYFPEVQEYHPPSPKKTSLYAKVLIQGKACSEFPGLRRCGKLHHNGKKGELIPRTRTLASPESTGLSEGSQEHLEAFLGQCFSVAWGQGPPISLNNLSTRLIIDLGMANTHLNSTNLKYLVIFQKNRSLYLLYRNKFPNKLIL